MMRLDTAGRYVFSCNHLGCGATMETREGRRAEAWRIAERRGWVRRNAHPSCPPAHYCKDHR